MYSFDIDHKAIESFRDVPFCLSLTSLRIAEKRSCGRAVPARQIGWKNNDRTGDPPRLAARMQMLVFFRQLSCHVREAHGSASGRAFVPAYPHMDRSCGSGHLVFFLMA
ncbi:hypothetical protein [Pseudomonas viridiflava]|uniref:hypothetical protein n=1 Tax=Pseudomonas viridiflava TaxID=33069 RepID=UPI0013D31EEB|nr:hypothetical protein [Pseudomonas viridiflava]